MRFDSRRGISAAVGLLALGIIALAGNKAWHSYGELAAADRLVLINTLADRLIQTAGIVALERGYTSAAIGARGPARPALVGKIQTLRNQGDAAWATALDVAEQAAVRAAASRLRALIADANRSYAAIMIARRRVDAALRGARDGIGSAEWLAAAGRFIHDTARLREAAFAEGAIESEVARGNLVIKNRAWTISEYAGQERANLAYSLSAGRPLTAEKLDELKALRGVVMHLFETMRGLRDVAEVDERIMRAVEAMSQDYFGRFERTRRQVYAAAATGRYPMSAEQWLEAATAAIDSIHAVIAAASAVIAEKAQQIVAQARRTLALQSIVAASALLLALVSFTRIKQTADTMHYEKELAEVTLHSIGDAVITTDAQARVEYLNPIAETLTGWSVKAAKGRPLAEVFRIINGVTREPQVNPAEKCLKENRIVGLENNTVLICRDGSERVIEDSAAPVRDREEKVVGAVMVFYDVTLMRNSTHLLSYHATHDALTGLVNRREIERDLTRLVENAKLEGKEHVLGYLDLDQFKVVNDTCGHIAGDKLLRQLAFHLKGRVRDTDTLARLGGDEFGVLLDSCPLEAAHRLAEGLLRAINDFRFVWEGETFEIGASIGMVRITPQSGSPAELLAQADSACYAAKEKGRNRFQLYEPGDVEFLRRQDEMHWVARIRHALEENRFTLYCQPIQPLRDGADPRHYCEMLIRMVDESGNLVPPMAFIPAAERYGLMPAIDRWVIRKALSTFFSGRKDSGRNVLCFINLSGASLADTGMLEFIRKEIRAHGVAPERICFEITETAAVANLDAAIAFIKALKETGCRFALDDFGSGMSSFAYLKNLPVDYLKISGAFVLNVAHNPTDRAMVDAINHVGHVMGILTVAESVESDQILEPLKAMGVDFAQGYGIARPAPMEEYLASATAESV